MFRRQSPRGRHRSARFSYAQRFAFSGRSVDRLVDHKRGGTRLSVEPLEDRRLLAAVRLLPGLEANSLERGDNISAFASLDFEVQLFGEQFDELTVNTNGYVTLGGDGGAGAGEIVPRGRIDFGGELRLPDLGLPILAPFWSDVDTTNPATGEITFGSDTIDGQNAFGVNWLDVTFDGGSESTTNSFQMVLIDRSDVEPLAFDLEFNYDAINWESGVDSGGDGGMGGASARAGFSSDQSLVLEQYELIGSGDDGAFLDGNQTTGLINNSLRSLETGRYVFEFRSSGPLNSLGLAGQAVQLADDVLYLGAGGHPLALPVMQEPTNANSIDTSDANRVGPGGAFNTNLTGAGVTVGVVEATERPGNTFDAMGNNVDAMGNFLPPSAFVRLTHTDFGGRVTTPGAAPTTFADHATHVAGTIGGAGPTNGYAPGVMIESFGVTGAYGVSAADAVGLDITNHSYGQGAGWSTIGEAQIIAVNIQNFAMSDLNGDGDTTDNVDLWQADRTAGVEDPRFGVYSTLDASIDAFLVAPGRENLLRVRSAGNERNDQFGNIIGTNQYVTYFGGGFGGGAAGWYVVPATGNAASARPNSDGNAGAGYDSVTPGSAAKNQITVGSIDQITVESGDPAYSAALADINQLSGFSSYGPLDDGRLAVHLVADGDSLSSSGASSDTVLVNKGGTSMASPSVAGTAALVLQHYRNLAGGGGSLLPATPTSATQRALLMHTAEDMLTEGPDYATGYGVVQADGAVQLLGSANGTDPIPSRTDRVIQDAFTAGDPPRTFTIDVDEKQEVIATLAWNDAPGAGLNTNSGGVPNAPPNIPVDAQASVLVNNLDVFITGPDGATFRPWVLDPTQPANAASTGVNNVDNVEQVRFDAPLAGEYAVTVGTANGMLGSGDAQAFSLLLTVAGDALEDNDSIETATVLGSETEVTILDLSIDDDGDVDFYKLTAHDAGKLIVRAYFDHDDGDLDVEIQDVNGNVIEASDDSSATANFEEIVIPVVSQEMYFIRVAGVDGATNVYDLEVENFPTPVPTGVHLDPASDTGMMNNDNVTADPTPRFFIQTDVLNFVDEDQSGSADVDEIQVLTAAEAEEGLTAGIAVQLTLVNTTAGTSDTFFADPLIAAVPEVYHFTPDVDLDSGVYFVTARTKIFDGQGNQEGEPAPAMGRSNASPPLWFTILAGDDVAGQINAELLTSSDSGMFDDDNVTKKWEPAFQGVAPAGFKVRLYANGELVGQTVAGSDTSDVGIGGVDGLGGAPDDGLGLWEITSEPLDENGYDITLEVEDAAGNVTPFDPMLNGEDQPIDVVIDKTAPNTPLLDLLDDTGRSDVDNITLDNDPQFSMTTTDPNVALAQLLYEDNLKFRVYDRFDGTAETLVYDSAPDVVADNSNVPGDMFTVLTLLTRTIGPLDDGVHNLKLEVEDRAGNISEDFLLEIIVDTAAPPVAFGVPTDSDGLADQSDTGTLTDPATFNDLITSDATPLLVGQAEADSVVRVYADVNLDGTVDPGDVLLGQTVAVPIDGNDAFPDGYWEITSAVDLNDPDFFPRDGRRQLLATAQDVAGNVNLPDDQDDSDAQQVLNLFVDTQGPQIADVSIDGFDYDLFDPKPSVNGPTPVIDALRINFVDFPGRLVGAPSFEYEAVAANAFDPGNYRLVGDHVGVVAIASVGAAAVGNQNGQPATAAAFLNFFEPLPDDRYTLTISDSITDPAGNALDGESNADEPQQDPAFPSGDGVPGGDFVARFTVDTRPEIASYVPQGINVDINGNFIWDPHDLLSADQTNVDLTFTMGVADPFTGAIAPGGFGVHDLVFAGQFAPQIVMEYEEGGIGRVGEEVPSGFDQLAVYGNAQDLGAFRWLIDTNSDGIVNIADGDILSIQPSQSGFDVAGAIPVAGNLDRNAENGDEIGLYKAGVWVFDTDRDFVVETNGDDTIINGTLLGHPIVGDFDGDDFDDLGVFNNNVWSFDFVFDGLGVTNTGVFAADFGGGDRDDSLIWGFPGVLDRPVAADMDQDGIDDIGLWVPRDGANPPQAVAEWYFLISNHPQRDGNGGEGENGNGNGENEEAAALHALGTIGALDHPFEPVPFGFDLYAEFGFERGLPLVGNFDPPVAESSAQSVETADFNADNLVDGFDFLQWQRGHGNTDASHSDGDANGDGSVDSADLAVWEAGMHASAVATPATLGSGSTSQPETLVAVSYFTTPQLRGHFESISFDEAKQLDAALARDEALARIAPPARRDFTPRPRESFDADDLIGADVIGGDDESTEAIALALAEFSSGEGW